MAFTTASLYRKRRFIAYCLNPNADWTNPEVQAMWEYSSKRVGRFLTEDYPLTEDELDALWKVYKVQNEDPHDRLVMEFSISYQLSMLMDMDIVLMVKRWPFEF